MFVTEIKYSSSATIKEKANTQFESETCLFMNAHLIMQNCCKKHLKILVNKQYLAKTDV